MLDQRVMLGTWRMLSWQRTVVATGEVSDAMGPDPVGYIAYHPDGRMTAMVFTRDRIRPATTAPTAEEKIRLFDTMLAYTGTYTLEADRVVHHVDAAWNPAWQTDQVRPLTCDGETLVISGAPAIDPSTGEEVLYRIEFRKV